MAASSDPQVALQRGLYALLSNDAGLKAAAQPSPAVYDSVPAGASFPYVTIAEADGHPQTAAHDPTETYVTIHIWSRVPGLLEAKAIGAAIRDALKTYPTVEGHQVTTVMLNRANYARDPDGVTAHGVQVWRFRTAPLPPA